MEVEHWMGYLGLAQDSSTKLRIPLLYSGSEGSGDNLQVQEGNNPDHKLRSLNEN